MQAGGGAVGLIIVEDTPGTLPPEVEVLDEHLLFITNIRPKFAMDPGYGYTTFAGLHSLAEEFVKCCRAYNNPELSDEEVFNANWDGEGKGGTNSEFKGTCYDGFVNRRNSPRWGPFALETATTPGASFRNGTGFLGADKKPYTAMLSTKFHERNTAMMTDSRDVVEEKCKKSALWLEENNPVDPAMYNEGRIPGRNESNPDAKDGRILMVNGAVQPTLDIEADTWVRLRVVFAAVDSIIMPLLPDGPGECEWKLLAKVPAPRRRRHLPRPAHNPGPE